LKIAGGIPPYIYSEIGGVDRWIWFVLAYLIALAGVCPFVGSLSDLIGRRYVALIGSILILVGVIISSTAHHMNPFIGELEIVFPLRIKSLSAAAPATGFWWRGKHPIAPIELSFDLQSGTRRVLFRISA
jgi:MFS family permease